jgi:hypothetical protein
LKWIDGTTGWLMSVYPDHMSHDSEVLVQLVSVSYNYYHCLQKLSVLIHDNIFTLLDLKTCQMYSSHFEYIIYRLDRIISGKSLSYQTNNWIRNMLSLYLDYFHSRTVRMIINNPKLQMYLQQANVNWNTTFDITSIPLYYHDDIFEIDQDMCFNRVVLFGRSNGHVTYFTSSLVANDFKCYLYSYYYLKVENHFLLNFNEICSFDLLNIVSINSDSNLNFNNNQYFRQRKIKITITIRSGDNRQYLNLMQLHKMIINDLSEESLQIPIDIDWLQSHMIYAGGLTVKQQAKVFSETDIAIVGHGAEIMNGMFMRSGSVLIDVFNAGYYENYFEPMLRELGILMIPFTVTNHTKQTVCNEVLDQRCSNGTLLEGNSLDCISIRNCNINLDLMRLKQLLQQAYLHIISAKFLYPSSSS